MKTKLFLVALTTVHLCLTGAARAGNEYVAHEWGTFTSVQGADGVQMAWNPLTVSELPGFVYNATHTNWVDGKRVPVQLTKSMFQTYQRMETPVIYFYSEREQTVDVTVKFPQGIVTEWYPQIVPASSERDLTFMGPKTIQWKGVQVLPKLRHESLASLLPVDPSGSHYYAARQAEADYLKVKGNDPARAETEQFLFYRGVGNFRAPLTVTQSGEEADTLTLSNTGKEELRHLFVYAVRGEQAKFMFVPELPPGTNRHLRLATAPFTALSDARATLAGLLEEALMGEGLFRAEAKAMVQTWNDSWFSEPGVRVLYTLPRTWTDRILPLTLEPKPREVARVMVGRAELITPSMEWGLMKQIVRFTESDPATRAQAVADTRRLGLGRFLEPAAQRLVTKLPHSQLQQASGELIRLATSPDDDGKKLAAK